MEDLIYAAKRNALHPEAIAIADKMLEEHIAAGGSRTERRYSRTIEQDGCLVDETFRWDFWTQFFHEAMEKLVRERGLVK